MDRIILLGESLHSQYRVSGLVPDFAENPEETQNPEGEQYVLFRRESDHGNRARVCLGSIPKLEDSTAFCHDLLFYFETNLVF